MTDAAPRKDRIYSCRDLAALVGMSEPSVCSFACLFPSFFEEGFATFNELCSFFVLGPLMSELLSVFPNPGRAMLALSKNLPKRIRNSESPTPDDLTHFYEGWREVLGDMAPMAPEDVDLFVALASVGISRASSLAIWNPSGLMEGFFVPTRQSFDGGPKTISVTLSMNYGRPAIAGVGVDIVTVRDRFMCGDAIELLAQDYGCSCSQVQDAIRAQLLLDNWSGDD